MVDDKIARKIIARIVKKLSEIRDDKEFSYDNLAMLVGTNKSTIHAMEHNKSIPNFLTLVKICIALDIKLSDIAKDVNF